MKHVICVGAVYIDTILGIPKFPVEDEKLRATDHVRRRGGNCANTLEVLSQIVSQDDENQISNHLITILPNKSSAATKFIRDSIPSVNTDFCVFQEEYSEAASCYVLQNAQNHSRTIISHNPFQEMSTQEFVACMSNLTREKGPMNGWIHFEGRVPNTTMECVRYVRRLPKQDLKISVECEKPEREGMGLVAREADVVFFSKIWVNARGYTDPRSFLESQIDLMMPDATLCCTWGEAGAVAVRKHQNKPHEWAIVPAWKPDNDSSFQVVDTIGAGDTFIAGMLFALAQHEDDWSLEEKLELANELAGRKVLQHGFSNLFDRR